MKQDAENICVVPVHHRSRQRIKELGEVFTTEKYIDEMLDMLVKENKKLWMDESIVFFEPTCGHGNFVVAIIDRRIKALYEKAKKQNKRNPVLFAVANAMNTIWAIDIDEQNIRLCRTRVFSVLMNFIIDKMRIDKVKLVRQNREFIAHIISCIKWQIHENEALSALMEQEKSLAKAGQTILGMQWIEKHSHKYIDFDLNWVEYFKAYSTSKTTPIEYQRSLKFLDELNRSNKYHDFDFARLFFYEDQSKSMSKFA